MGGTRMMNRLGLSITSLIGWFHSSYLMLIAAFLSIPEFGQFFILFSLCPSSFSIILDSAIILVLESIWLTLHNFFVVDWIDRDGDNDEPE